MSEVPCAKIDVTGEDAFAFLQAQFATDLRDVSRQHALRVAWCNPKGRVICIASALAVDQAYSIELPAELAEKVLQRLTMFRFRARVDFALRNSGVRSSEQSLEMLRAGIVEIFAAQSEKFTPHMLNLDLLQVVSLDKGCYPGQEIVARTHYRGTSKRRCLRFVSSVPVAAGASVLADGREVGAVVNAIGTDLLAVVPLEYSGPALHAGEATLTQQSLPYDIS